MSISSVMRNVNVNPKLTTNMNKYLENSLVATKYENKITAHSTLERVSPAVSNDILTMAIRVL